MMNFLRTRLLTLVLAGTLIFLQYHLWFQPDGVLSVSHARKQLMIETSVNEALKADNEKLITQIKFMKSNKDVAIESQARQDLGMIKKGETFYQVIKK